MQKERLVSGMRPTGKLHLGHLQGALTNWVDLQHKYDCFYFIADLHALTTKFDENLNLMDYSIEMLAEWLAVGLDYKKCTIFEQSMIKQHSELFLFLSMITPISWLERCPTYKEQLTQLTGKELHNLGFLSYPVLMTADVIIYDAKYVPVGEDQLPHLELAREIVRKFNNHYNTNIFKEPQALLTKTPRLMGLDGRKMSKSYDNSIYLSDDFVTIEKKARSMITDGKRIKATDLGHPEICNVFSMHKIFNISEKDEIEESCKKGQIGCVQCKKKLINVLEEKLKPIREKRQHFLKDKDFLFDILREGSKKTSEIAEKMLIKVRDIMKVF